MVTAKIPLMERDRKVHMAARNFKEAGQIRTDLAGTPTSNLVYRCLWFYGSSLIDTSLAVTFACECGSSLTGRV